VAEWRGVRVSELARIAGIDPRVRYVEFRSFDANYWSSWDIGSALHPQTLLAYGMNGHELRPEHGAPIRLYSAVKLGYKSVKYLARMTVVDTVKNLGRGLGGVNPEQGYSWFAGI